LTLVLDSAADFFRPSAPDSNKILVLFTNSLLPSNVSALATVARQLFHRDIKVVLVNTGGRSNHSSWFPDLSLFINAEPSDTSQRRTVYEIGRMVYGGK
jgi:hypothetical protein